MWYGRLWPHLKLKYKICQKVILKLDPFGEKQLLKPQFALPCSCVLTSGAEVCAWINSNCRAGRVLYYRSSLFSINHQLKGDGLGLHRFSHGALLDLNTVSFWTSDDLFTAWDLVDIDQLLYSATCPLRYHCTDVKTGLTRKGYSTSE